MSITLKTGSGLSEPFKNSEEDLKHKFNKAKVTAGKWILYSYKDYNDAQSGGNGSNHKILTPGPEEDISAFNGSMYLVQDEIEGFILFKHCFYGGKHKYYRESCENVNDEFPSGQGGGVSSAIILSQNENFRAFAKPNFEGSELQLQEGEWYDNFKQMGFNDDLQSIRKE